MTDTARQRFNRICLSAGRVNRKGMQTFWKSVRTVGFLLPLYACVQTQTPAPQTQLPTVKPPVSNDLIIRNFDIVGFGNKYTQRRHTRVRKWKTPIRVGLQSFSNSPYLQKTINDHIHVLRELTGHPIDLIYPPPSPRSKDLDSPKVNFILYFYPPSKIFEKVGKYFHNDPDLVEFFLEKGTCFSKIFTRASEIVAGVVVLPGNYTVETIRACITDQMTLSLGLPNNSQLVSPSIFNDGRSSNFLSDHDKWMLRMFYDPRITAGMPRELAIDMGRKILSEIRPEGN